MGLIIKNNITITGTTIDIPEVYGRIEFVGRADGKTLEISLSTYASKNAFKNGETAIQTNIVTGNTIVELQEGETQTIETALTYTQVALEQLGYLVEVV
jgi:hypothetical protein